MTSSCQAYTGSVCSAVVNYTFSTPSAPWQVVETNLTDLGMNILKSFEASNPACIQELIALSCLQSFPQCSGQDSSSILLIYPCKSLCRRVQTDCHDLFQQMNRLSSLPICDAPISNTSIFYPDDISSGNNVICNTRLPQQKLDDSSSSNSSNSSSPSRPPSSSTVVTPIYQCPSPLVQNLSANNSATVKCVGSCCFKCPLLDNFYPVGAFEKYYLITDAISYISIAGMFFLSVSYTLLQSHRTSGNEPLRYLFYICLVLTCRTLFTANGLRSVQCVDDFTMSTQSNNKICGVQGLWVYIAALWYMCWAASISVNFLFRIVFKSEWLEDRKWIMHMFSWSIGIAFGIASYSLQAFEYLSLGNCFLSEQWAEPLFFYPLIAITVIMSLPFFITTFHIAYVILRDPVSKPRLGNRRGSAANILNLRIKLRKFLLLQWRPLVWNSANIIASYTFIISYYKFLKPYNNAKSDSIWEEEWINCLYSANGSQDYCSKTVSMNNLPSISSLMIVDVLPLVPPLITLAVFIPASSIFSEIRKYIYRRESKDSSFLSSIQSKGGLGSWAQESLAKGYKEFTHDVGLEGSQIYNSSRAGGGGVTSMDCNVTLNRRLSTRHKHHQQLHTLGDSGQVLVVQGTSNADAIDIADEEIELQKM